MIGPLELAILVPGVAMALLARRKGYSVICWFFAASIIGLIILAFLPNAKKGAFDEEIRRKKVRRGNTAGAVLSVIFVLSFFVYILVTILSGI